MKKLHLRNDNNKLHCACFLHVQLYKGVDVWPPDQGYEIYSGGTYLGEAKIVSKSVSTIGKLNESVAAITTGFSMQVLKAELSGDATAGFPITNDSKIHVITFRYLKYGKDHPLAHQRAPQPKQQHLWNTRETAKANHSSANV